MRIHLRPKPLWTALALALGAHQAQANTIIPADSMMTGITQELLKRVKQENPKYEGQVRVKSFRVIDARINGKPPAPKEYYDLDRAVPYLNCDPKNPSSDKLSVEVAHTQEVSFSRVQSTTVGVSMEVSGQIGGVGASVAASFERTFETGQTNTTSRSEAVSKEKNVTVDPLHGTWISPYGQRYEYTNAPYEVEVEVTEAQMGANMPGGPVWLPLLHRTPPRFTVTGKVTAKIPLGEMGLVNIPMDPAETAANCPKSFDQIAAGAGAVRKPATAGVAAPAGAPSRSHFVGVVPPNQRKLLKPPVAPK